MSDLTNELNLITTRLSEKLQVLETEYQRWHDYKTDYDALENQLRSLPDTTTRSAMIPIGKLGFMPGKLIHTNEVLVLLGEQYYAERSAKQAVDILKRRRQVVNENLSLVEAQLNSFKQKTNTIMNSSALPLNEAQVNEEGLPIMDIREELPSNYDQEQSKKKNLIQKKPTSTNELPESVLRAREMMKEADEKIKNQDEDNKALFELLRELEEEEEEQEEKVLTPVPSEFVPKEEESEDDEDRYDTEISENMFDRFADDEQYPLEGTVDQEDFTCYEEEVPLVETATITEIIEEKEVNEIEEENERSTPKLITKRKSKEQPKIEEKPIIKEEASIEEAPKKMSRFKLAQLEKKKNSTITENIQERNTVEQNETKKFSKFKLLRQQDQDRKKVEIVETKVKEIVKENEIPEEELTESFENMMIEPKKTLNVPVQDNGIPKVLHQPKKMSKFKLARQKEAKVIEVPNKLIESPIEVIEKPKRSVTWDTNNSVKDHDNSLAPSVVSETKSYSQPMKKEETKMSLHQQIKSASDIYRTIQSTQNSLVDDYPSLDEENDKKVDLNELIKIARESSETFWKPNDGTEALIPMVRHNDEEQNGIIVAKKNKLDNKIMKGAVLERDNAPIDLEQVEEDMDMREISTNYQQMRLNMLASTGGFSFDTKPEFEVFDEELPLPKKKEDQQEEEIVVPKKMSRFKAARLGMRMQEEEEYQ